MSNIKNNFELVNKSLVKLKKIREMKTACCPHIRDVQLRGVLGKLFKKIGVENIELKNPIKAYNKFKSLIISDVFLTKDEIHELISKM